MANYKIGSNQWLLAHSNIVSSLFLNHLQNGVEYTPQELLSLLHTHGHNYSSQELVILRNELIKRGVLEEVA